MRIIRFYCPELSDDVEEIDLPEAAHRHAIQVLRLKQGDLLRLFNGSGLEYEAQLIAVTKRRSQVKLGSIVSVDNESPLNITLLQGVSRGERMDYAFQKAVELGVKGIIPVITERCNVQLSAERVQKRQQHWQGVIISACEQSGRSIVPQLMNVMPLADALDSIQVSCGLVLDPLAEKGFRDINQQQEIALLIGPEGGLTAQEIKMANQAEFHSICFGPRILRTETATVAALAVVQTLWGDAG